MKIGWKIVIIVVIIVLIVLAALCIKLEVPRSLTFNNLDKIFQLDAVYSKKRRVKSQEKVIVSLTTTPQRISVIYPTLSSLLDQTVRVDQIVINVPWVSRKGIEYHIPGWLKKLKSVTVMRVENDEGPATKLLPTLRREGLNSKIRIIVFDDDNIYHSTTIARLMDAFEKYNCHGKKVAITHYGVLLEPDGHIPGFLTRSRLETTICSTRPVDLLQGCHGFVVSPCFFPKQSLDRSKGPPEAVSVDDIWFSCWLSLNNVEIRLIGSTWETIPLVNFGEVNRTPKLVNGENAGLVRDQIVVDWFMRVHHYVPVLAR